MKPTRKIMENSDKSIPTKKEEGFTYATLIVSVVSIFVVFVVIGYCQWQMKQKDEEFKLLLHNKEEESAYKFTWVKNQLNLMTTTCKAKAEKIEQWQAWNAQNSTKQPPLLLLTGQNQNDCVFAVEIPPMPKKEGE